MILNVKTKNFILVLIRRINLSLFKRALGKSLVRRAGSFCSDMKLRFLIKNLL
jgi:hypothetical protein